MDGSIFEWKDGQCKCQYSLITDPSTRVSFEPNLTLTRVSVRLGIHTSKQVILYHFFIFVVGVFSFQSTFIFDTFFYCF